MLAILSSEEKYAELDENSRVAVENMRADFKGFSIQDCKFDCPIIEKEGDLQLYTFTGTKINKSLSFLFELTGIESSLDDRSSSFSLDLKKSEISQFIQNVNKKYEQINDFLIAELQKNESLIGFSKWVFICPWNIKWK
jgi:ATP-dependent Lhr-like helicase